ncbi:dethiobiotin synthase [Thermovibrio ammonificans]|uniref:ATP-dependent dethiobiotin synthetase BioD n=1 Tax=Thermovibrio ammonificans (strain DSM 15698 / JCM 12110 / HB-1) TaxID=648996 RepID=E8T2M6_THEA1|nr:dethiobiotin synthase [Thermovibrio ammonificans]ADU97121.1 dethiobiotin synthase [Thermovibrio ammonificans HB-1]
MLFVTGTDTGVGKSFFTASLVRALRGSGFNAAAFKPVETGCEPECEDALLLSRASGVYLEPVYSLKRPLAPAVAAELEGVTVDFKAVVSRIEELSALYSPLVVEGAGGVMVPITWEHTYLDLAVSLSARTVVVALNKLGVINHTLLTVGALKSAGVKVACVVLNSPNRYDESVDTNYDTLKRLLDVEVFLFSSPPDALKVVSHLF